MEPHIFGADGMYLNMQGELGPIYRKKSAFRDEFHKVITEMYTIEEFEDAWKQLLEKYGLQEHHFLVKAHDKRKKWAKAYNKDKFCARMMSTQRSEVQITC